MLPTIRFGSMNYVTLMANKYDDILYVMKSTEPLLDVKIICKPNYNIDEVLEFTKEHLPLGVTYEIIVENISDVIT